MKQKLRVLYISIIFLVVLFIPWTNYGPELSIYALDVGQGDSTLIVTPQKFKILIDGGPDSSVVDQIDSIMAFWDRDIDIVMLSHPDLDHVGGLNDITQRFKVGQILWTGVDGASPAFISFQEEASMNSIKRAQFTRDSLINSSDGVMLHGLWPVDDRSLAGKNKSNASSQVLHMKYKYFTALFTGDIDTNVAHNLEVAGSLSDIDYLKVPHHGSKYGFTPEQLQSMSPLVSTISVGADNRYGHPAVDTISLLERVNSYIYRTDEDGRVLIKINDSGISVTPEKNSIIERL